jgi:exopolysaccharide production protein ExoZ
MQAARQTESSAASPPLADAASATPSKAPGEVRSIQYLRGFAAFGVLVFHAADRAGGAFGVGAAGVDIFFVISGFIMWVVTCRKTPSPSQFLLRRVERIVPLYWMTTLGVALIAIVVPAAFPAMRPTFQHVAQSLLFIPHRDAEGQIAPLIVPGWTLNYEMFFYLIFALALLAAAKVRPFVITAALLALVVIRPLGDPQNPLWATYTNPLLLEFVAGVWLGKAWSEGRLPGAGAAWAMIAVGLVGFTAVHLSGVDVEPARILYWGLPALLMVAGAVSLERRGPIPEWRPLRLLGDASYSVYLVHGLAISAAFRILHMVGLEAPAVVLPVSLATGVVAGLLTYQFVEKPLMRLFKTGMAAHRPKATPPLAAAVAPATDASAAP